MSMVAAIERDECVVWGIGFSAAEALSEAKIEIAKKPQFKVGDLEIAALDDSADPDDCGTCLWAHVILKSSPVQDSLF